MNVRVAMSLGMLVVWLVIFGYFLIQYPHFRDPFGGDGMVQACWVLFALALVWNLIRAYFSWKPARPPVRRTYDGRTHDE